MTLPKDPFKSWLLPILLGIVLSLTGVAYAAVTTRLTDLETDRKEAVLNVEAVKTQLALLQQTMSVTKSTLDEVRNQQNLTLQQLGLLLSNSRDAAKWRSQTSLQGAADSRRWNAAMDVQPKKR